MREKAFTVLTTPPAVTLIDSGDADRAKSAGTHRVRAR